MCLSFDTPPFLWLKIVSLSERYIKTEDSEYGNATENKKRHR